jgi:hypothetical protein
MFSGLVSRVRLFSRILIRNRLLLSAGFSVAAGIILGSVAPISIGDPLLRYVELDRPDIYHTFVLSYQTFLFTTPFLLLFMFFSLVYIHFYAQEVEPPAGALPPYPSPEHRKDLFLVLGELHEQLKPAPSADPQWLSIPERGLYTGIATLGAIGSGKTRGLILPAMRQLFGYRAGDSAKKLSGIVLEVGYAISRSTWQRTQRFGIHDTTDAER